MIPGDISWATKWEEAVCDLEFLASLPGHKYLVEGNHDYWLFSKRNPKKRWIMEYDNDISTMRIIHGDSHIVTVEDRRIALTGARGWSNQTIFDTDDEKIIKRELMQLQRSIDHARNHKFDQLVVMMHYPPTEQVLPDQEELAAQYDFELYDNRFWEKIVAENVDTVIFGHLHQTELPIRQYLDEIAVYSVAADLVDFDPIEIS